MRARDVIKERRELLRLQHLIPRRLGELKAECPHPVLCRILHPRQIAEGDPTWVECSVCGKDIGPDR